MNPEEILAVLRIDNLDEVEDALESELFEIRKSILAKPLLRLTLKSKLARLNVLAKIAENQQLFREPPVFQFVYDGSKIESALSLWESYMQARSQWKMVFTQTQTPIGLTAVLEEGVKMELEFASKFPVSDWTEEEPVFGTEPDPMLLQNGLKKAAEKGWITFSDLEKNKNGLEKDLLLALKRLSLLPKYLQ
ncbi:hypothetical protein [uncultured Fluviicola sp.]|uniref:hypothetical protein n=1 Tax=uncultured Fluviicola sp. TaxID=463303 RepID=UPI0025E26541|nr:hypothetical protein [uncultured Fluviicola sp.]